jgi:hypothetical protein
MDSVKNSFEISKKLYISDRLERLLEVNPNPLLEKEGTSKGVLIVILEG